MLWKSKSKSGKQRCFWWHYPSDFRMYWPTLCADCFGAWKPSLRVGFVPIDHITISDQRGQSAALMFWIAVVGEDSLLWDTVGQGQVSPAHGSMAPKRVYDRMVDLGRPWARSLGIGDGDVAVAIIADGREWSCLKHTSSLQAWPARKCTVIMESNTTDMSRHIQVSLDHTAKGPSSQPGRAFWSPLL